MRPGKFLNQSFFKGLVTTSPKSFVKKDTYIKFGPYKPEIGNSADIELMYRYLEILKIKNIFVDKIFIKMRYGGVSNNSLKNIIKQNYSILKF